MKHNMIYQRSFWLCLLCSLLMVGCKNGCTFTRTIKKISKPVQVGAQKMEIVVSLTKSKNIKMRKGDLKISSSGSWYNVRIDLKADTMEIPTHWSFSAEQSTKLKPYLDKTELQSRSDAAYFVFRYTEAPKQEALYQRLGQRWMESPYFEDFQNGKYTLETLPTEEAFFEQLIADGDLYKKLFFNMHYIRWYIEQKELPEKVVMDLLACLETERADLATAYFSERNLKKLGDKYPKFKKDILGMAVNAAVKNTSSYNDTYEKVLMVLGNQETFAKCDKIIFASWQGSWSGRNNAYVKTRLADNKNPINPALAKQLNTRCKLSIDKTIAGDKNYDNYHYGDNFVHFKNAVSYMLWTKDKPYQEKLVNYYLADKEKTAKDLADIFESDFNNLDASLRPQIIAYAKQQFDKTVEGSDAFEPADWYNFLDGKMACSEMKELLKKYTEKGKSQVFLKNKKPDC